MNNFLTYYDRYNHQTKTYSHGRSAGLFAMLNWVLRQITLLEMDGREIENIELYLDEYFNRQETFKEFFTIKDTKLTLNELSSNEKINFYNKTNWSYIGFSESPRQMDLSITNQVIKKYFNPTKEVIDWYNLFVDYLGGEIEDIVFVWARATDKQSESKLPSIDTYLKTISTINTTDKKIVIQTDDELLLKSFSDRGIVFSTLPKIPFPKRHNQPFHINLRGTDNIQFERSFGISKIDYLRQMVALSLICVRAHKTIMYPGNPTTFVSSMKGSLDNLILFKNDEELF